MALSLRQWFKPGMWRFQWRYLRGLTPWDTQITPPEVMEFLATTPPGRALDLGCGTGTNAITLSRHGWQVVAVDFVPSAIFTARKKAAAARQRIVFNLTSVTDLSMIPGKFDYALDIGCFFGLPVEERGKYVANLAERLLPDGWFMLYAWCPRERQGKQVGVSVEEVDRLLSPDFERRRLEVGEEAGAASAWYWYRRR